MPSARASAGEPSSASALRFPLCDSLDRILDDRSVEAVLVLTPANTHLDIARRCAEAGKHVLLEKPIEITTARAGNSSPRAAPPASRWGSCFSTASGRPA